MRISGKHLTPEEICNIVEQNYHAMKLAGKWDGVLVKALLSENMPGNEDTKKVSEGKQHLCTGPRFEPPASGRSDWKIV
eukprot:6514149-Ditylum_brightwellii.AAC.1